MTTDLPPVAYAVSTGIYSSQRTHGIFINKADAEAVVDRFNREQNPRRDIPFAMQTEIEIEEFPLFGVGERPELLIDMTYGATFTSHVTPQA